MQKTKQMIKSTANPRWYIPYTLLILFNVMAVLAGLYVSHSVTENYKASVAINQTWSERRDGFSKLRQLVGQMDEPGNDIFETRDVEGESFKLRQSESAFDHEAAVLAEDLRKNISGNDQQVLVNQLKIITHKTRQLSGDADLIFANFNKGDIHQATRHMAAMDRKFAEANSEFTNAINKISSTQKTLFAGQLESAISLRRFEYVLAIFIFVMVVAATVYGYRLHARMKAKEREKEQFIDQLTEAESQARALLEQVRQSESQYSDLFENSSDLIHSVTNDGRYLFVNPSWHRVLGYSVASLVKMNVFDVIHPDHHEEYARIRARMFAGEKFDNIQLTFLTSDGRSVYVEGSADCQFKGGEPVATRGFFRDVTERRQLTERLELQSAALESAANGVAITGQDGNIQWVNAAFTRLTGYEATEAIGQNPRILNSGRHKPEFYGELWATITQGKVWHGELYNRRKDGSVYPEEMTITPVRDVEGQIKSFVAIKQDITDRKQMELDLAQARDAAIESARLKSEFLANMSHEIRTPMNGVIGMTGLLLDSELNADQRDCAETIRSSGEALLTIINDILDFSKIEAGMLQFDIVDFDLRNAVEGTVELLAEKAREKKIEFASLVHCDVPTALRGDPGRLRQVLTNLTGNAVKFTETGEVVVSAEKEFETEGLVTIRFSVKDSGIGISEEAQKKLFQAFTQADGSTTRKYGGTGLGLSISKQLVELMEGQIGEVSTPGTGSTFWFTASFEKQPVEATQTLPHIESLANLRVLVVDDNATNRKILSHQLNSWGMLYSEAESGARALELLRAAAAHGEAYDLVVLDFLMPGMDGFTLAKAIKADSNISRARLVLLTSAGERGDGARSRAAGISAYLSKPVRQSQLFDCLISVMSKSHAGDESAALISSTLVTKHTLLEAKKMSDKLILLAEDNIVNQKVAIRRLQKLGYRCDAVANGREAIEALGRIPYDLVLMDCQMPEMDGYEATAAIRRQQGRMKLTPIVAMTAHALAGDREKCLAAGMDDYITKPIEVAELQRVLETYMADPKPADIETGAVVIEAPVDLVRMHSVMGDEPEEFSEILDLYLETMSENLNRLGEALKVGSQKDVELAAHNGAGTSANCGMTAVVDSLRELERAGREGQLAQAPHALAEAKHQFAHIKTFLAAHLKTFDIQLGSAS